MRVLIGCEYSGVVRDAFIARGHDAMSCDLLPTDAPGPHYQGDIFDVIDDGWDLGIFHPPCTFLASSGAKHLYWLDRTSHTIWHEGERIPNYGRMRARDESVEFVRALLGAPIPRIAVENPQGMLSSLFRKPDQYVEPWQFGHPESKKTGLWLKNLPPLVETDNVHDHMMTLSPQERERIHRMPPGPDRWKLRSTTFTGIAAAMAQQWGPLATEAAA